MIDLARVGNASSARLDIVVDLLPQEEKLRPGVIFRSKRPPGSYDVGFSYR